LVYHRVVTDGQTDRRTDRNPIANTRSQQYLPVQLSRVKTPKFLSTMTKRKQYADALFSISGN